MLIGKKIELDDLGNQTSSKVKSIYVNTFYLY